MGQGARRLMGCALAAALGAAASAPAYANDRPFLQTSNAAAEEDDDQVWSVETWWQGAGAQHVFSMAPEYAFNPTTSLQLELSHTSGDERGNEAELEFKHLFNHIGRDGWGWGIDVSLGPQSLALKLPYTLQLRDGDALLHLNAGLQKQRDERREWIASAAFEHKLPWHSSAFVELGREDRQTLWHAGVRHWLRRDKLALDVSVQQLRSGGEKASGVVFGLAWYDL